MCCWWKGTLHGYTCTIDFNTLCSECMGKTGKHKKQVFQRETIAATMSGSEEVNDIHTTLSKADIQIMAAVTEALKANKMTHNHHAKGESSNRHPAGEWQKANASTHTHTYTLAQCCYKRRGYVEKTASGTRCLAQSHKHVCTLSHSISQPCACAVSLSITSMRAMSQQKII